MRLMLIPKVRTGKFTIMDSDQEEEEIIDYGLVDEDKVNEPVQAVDNPNIPFGEEKQLEAPRTCTGASLR